MAGPQKWQITEGHLQFCDTEQQLEICKRRLRGDALSEIARDFGLQPTNISRTIKGVFQKARDRGFDPEHELDAPLPEGQGLAGVTNLYRFVDGKRELSQQYVLGRKQKGDEVAEKLQSFVDGLSGKITPAPKRKAPSGRRFAADLMPSIFIGDAHIGMRAFGQETKHDDFDTKIATSQLKEAFQYLTDRAVPSKHCLFVNVGDLIHANAQSNTTVSGTPLDVDTRHHATLRAAAETMAYGIDLQLQKHRKVTVVMARGNHDSDAASAIQLILEFYYKNEPRVTVLPAHGYVHYLEWGKWLIGIHHGDKMKAEKLGTVMARDMPEAWGRTTHRLWATGHFHKEAVKTLDGVKHKVFAALPPPDSWHASHGFAGDGEMEMLTFRREGGVESSIVYNVPQPRVEPDARID